MDQSLKTFFGRFTKDELTSILDFFDEPPAKGEKKAGLV